MREHDTYRSERRNAWRGINQTWSEHQEGYLRVGKPYAVGIPSATSRIQVRGRSKYMPHEGVKRGGTGPVYAA